MYVDVILPLALPGLLTYAVPDGDGGVVREGSRIVVPLRGKRLHTAVVGRVHQERPEYVTEPVWEALDLLRLLQQNKFSFDNHWF